MGFVQSGVVFYLHCLVSRGEGGVRARFGSRKTGLSSPVVRIVYNAASLSVPRRLPTFSSLYICNLSCLVHSCFPPFFTFEFLSGMVTLYAMVPDLCLS